MGKAGSPSMSDTEGPWRFLCCLEGTDSTPWSTQEGMAGSALGGGLGGRPTDGVGMAPGGGNGTEKATGMKYQRVVTDGAFVMGGGGDVGFKGQILGFIVQTLERLVVWSVPQRDHSGVRGCRAMGNRPGGTPEFMTRVWVDGWPFQRVGGSGRGVGWRGDDQLCEGSWHLRGILGRGRCG